MTKWILAGAGAAIVGWLAAPWVSMALRGTIDQRTVASWAETPADAPAGMVADDPPVELPSPRVPHDASDTSPPATWSTRQAVRPAPRRTDSARDVPPSAPRGT